MLTIERRGDTLYPLEWGTLEAGSFYESSEGTICVVCLYGIDEVSHVVDIVDGLSYSPHSGVTFRELNATLTIHN